jgi:hypothetical protein
MGNVTKFPGSTERRKRANLKDGKVTCQVTSRWLQFPEKASVVNGESYMFIDVMTLDTDERAKKLCVLCVTKEDLMAMLSRIPVEDSTS